MNSTAAQQRAVAARGNVLVVAGAGTGKTSTLVERCVNCLCDPASPVSLDELLIVTFTDAAAAEVRQRIREELEKRVSQAGAGRWAEQLALFDTAPIGTLHSFCFKLIRQHFHELGLDPQLTVLDEGQARLMANEALAAVLQEHYAARTETSEAVRRLIHTQAGGRDKVIRALVLQLHHYAQTRPNPGTWLASQLDLFASPGPDHWRQWLMDGIADWRAHWKPALAVIAATGNQKAEECRQILAGLADEFTRGQATDTLGQLQRASEIWVTGKKAVGIKPLKKFIEEIMFLASVTKAIAGGDPLAEDWEWTRGPMTTLLHLAREFSTRFSEIKRDAGAADFHDLEQFALQLLWDFGAERPTALARHWREKIRFVFVDEYQDINAAQDRIIGALSRDGADANRFLVGDVKQSIYRFRLADPRIFRDYAAKWHGDFGTTIPLSENFRSREGLLQFVNSVLALLMRSEIGGVSYDEEAKLRFCASGERRAFSAATDPSPRAELILRIRGKNESSGGGKAGVSDDLSGMEDAEKEARLVAMRLRELQKSGHTIWDKQEKTFRPAAWRDMAVLLRAPSNKTEGYAKEFTKAGVPLIVERGGFFQSSEVTDLLSLLQVLDNPLQDLPLLAVLRSPLVGLSLDELAAIRLAAHGRFWTGLARWHETQKSEAGSETFRKAGLFLERFRRWRQLARQASLSRCLETVLVETLYGDWLRAQERGEQRHMNVQKLLGLAQHFDQFQRQGLFRFLRFIEAQQEAEAEPEVAPVAEQNAVRLMSIHQSKGLEFPVVVVADLGKRFNEQDLRAEIILDEVYGLCPQIKPPHSGRRYPSLPWWLAQLRQRRELRGEELRLLYVAMTRARDTLILTGSISEKKWEAHWRQTGEVTTQSILAAQSYADWLGLWFARHADVAGDAIEGNAPYLRWSVHDDSQLMGPPEAEAAGMTPGADAFVLDATTERKLRSVLAWDYPFGAATRRAAKTSVTALRRQAAEHDEEAQPLFGPERDRSPAAAARQRVRRVAGGDRPRSKLSAADVGLAHHKFLEHIRVEQTLDPGTLRREAQRLERERILSPEETAALDLSALAAFWESEIGKKIRDAAPHVRRELAFTARFSPQELVAITGEELDSSLAGEFVVVQGVADLVVLLPREIWLVDFKTDEFAPAELAAKVKLYEVQLKLYAQALSRTYQREVTECWLQFLTQQKTVRVEV